MATREDNLKKINDELEILSDEELEQVAGGMKADFYKINDKEVSSQQNVFQNNNQIYNAKNHDLY